MLKPGSPPSLTTLILLSALSLLSLNAIVPSLANMATDLTADYAVISLTVGGYLAVTAVVQLAAGPLADRVGRRPVVLCALLVFAAASFVTAVAQDVVTLLVFRMLQASVVVGSVLSLAIVRDTNDGAEVARLIGKISMAMALAPMLGPMLGSLLDAAFGWRSIFLFYALAGAGLLYLTWRDLGETLASRHDASGKEPETLTALLQAPTFWCYVGCTTFSTGAFFIFITGAPLVATSVFGTTTAELGIAVGSITGGFMTGSYLSGRLGRHLASRIVMILGRLVACGGLTAGLAALASGLIHPLFFFGSTIFVGLGNGLTMPNSNAGALSVKPRLAGSAAGINGAMTLAGGAVMTTVTGYALADDPSPSRLLMLMLAAAIAGLLAALGAVRLTPE
ncbi:MAG: Bcr/CflA family efflux MFS transporter [Alphaproteobacteria bacterium]|nr:Bcr/CflA family efflux MFS transporter [Alphaproteobacteria bacterium]